jgi:uncharacterized membrane protein YeaQ/YmgE (transglycosylase-associated protein family)
MNLLVFIIFGAIVGWLTSLIMKTNTTQGLLGDIILGVLGALAGGLIMDLLNMPGITGFNFYSFIVAVIGALLVVGVGRTIRSGVK